MLFSFFKLLFYQNVSKVNNSECVFWDYTADENYGDWSTEGCWSTNKSNGIECACNHLTSFAVLMVSYTKSDRCGLGVDNLICV